MSETLNIDEQIKEIDNNLEVLDWNIKRAEALEKLIGMEEFQLVIMEGYLEIEAERVFNLLTHPLTVKPEDKESYLSQLDTIKNLGRYLGTSEYKGVIKISADNSKKDKETLISMKQKLLAGEGE
jgi:hypothetical protein